MIQGKPFSFDSFFLPGEELKPVPVSAETYAYKTDAPPTASVLIHDDLTDTAAVHIPQKPNSKAILIMDERSNLQRLKKISKHTQTHRIATTSVSEEFCTLNRSNRLEVTERINAEASTTVLVCGPDLYTATHNKNSDTGTAYLVVFDKQGKAKVERLDKPFNGKGKRPTAEHHKVKVPEGGQAFVVLASSNFSNNLFHMANSRFDDIARHLNYDPDNLGDTAQVIKIFAEKIYQDQKPEEPTSILASDFANLLQRFQGNDVSTNNGNNRSVVVTKISPLATTPKAISLLENQSSDEARNNYSNNANIIVQRAKQRQATYISSIKTSFVSSIYNFFAETAKAFYNYCFGSKTTETPISNANTTQPVQNVIVPVKPKPGPSGDEIVKRSGAILDAISIYKQKTALPTYDVSLTPKKPKNKSSAHEGAITKILTAATACNTGNPTSFQALEKEIGDAKDEAIPDSIFEGLLNNLEGIFAGRNPIDTAPTPVQSEAVSTSLRQEAVAYSPTP